MAAPSISPKIVYCQSYNSYRSTLDTSRKIWGKALFEKAYIQIISVEKNKDTSLIYDGIDLQAIKNITKFMESYINELPSFPHCYEVINYEDNKSYKVTYVLDKPMESIHQLHINSKKAVNLNVLQKYLQKWIQALQGLHHKGLAHGAINPSNLTKQYIINYLYLRQSTNQDLELIVPSRSYQPPESLLGQGVTEAADIWSLGATLFKLYMGEELTPIETTDNPEYDDLVHLHLLEKRCQKKFPKEMLEHTTFYNYNNQELWKISLNDSMEEIESIEGTLLRLGLEKGENGKALAYFLDFLEKCLAFDPNKRITASEALEHPLLVAIMEQEPTTALQEECCIIS